MAIIILCSRSSLLRRNMASMLSRLGHQVLETDGTIALVSACLTRRVDVIMVDEEQEHLTAAGAIACLRCHPTTAHVPIVALGLSVHRLQAAVAAGANHALVTPIETRSLLRILDVIAAQRALALTS